MAKSSRYGVPALERSPSHLLHQALQFALDVYGAQVEGAQAPLTQRQFAVLAAVEAHPAPTQTDLVRATGVDRSTLADMIARMIAKDLLARERSALDARANVVRLTAQGAQALAAMRPRAEAADAQILHVLGSGKRDGFVSALRALARAGEAALLEPKEDEARAAKKARKAAKADGLGKKPKKSKAKKSKKLKADSALAADAAPGAVDAPPPQAAEA